MGALERAVRSVAAEPAASDWLVRLADYELVWPGEEVPPGTFCRYARLDEDEPWLRRGGFVVSEEDGNLTLRWGDFFWRVRRELIVAFRKRTDFDRIVEELAARALEQ